MTCEVDVLEEDTIIELPYIYYPGYEVYVLDEEVETFESDNGFLAISISEPGIYGIYVDYTETLVTQISRIISIVSIAGFAIYIFIFWTKP